MKKCFLMALLYKEDGEYAAHCLEFDIAGTSKESFEDACDKLNELIQVYIEYAYENDDLEYLYNPPRQSTGTCSICPSSTVETIRRP